MVGLAVTQPAKNVAPHSCRKHCTEGTYWYGFPTMLSPLASMREHPPLPTKSSKHFSHVGTAVSFSHAFASISHLSFTVLQCTQAEPKACQFGTKSPPRNAISQPPLDLNSDAQVSQLFDGAAVGNFMGVDADTGDTEGSGVTIIVGLSVVGMTVPGSVQTAQRRGQRSRKREPSEQSCVGSISRQLFISSLSMECWSWASVQMLGALQTPHITGHSLRRFGKATHEVLGSMMELHPDDEPCVLSLRSSGVQTSFDEDEIAIEERLPLRGVQTSEQVRLHFSRNVFLTVAKGESHKFFPHPSQKVGSSSMHVGISEQMPQRRGHSSRTKGFSTHSFSVTLLQPLSGPSVLAWISASVQGRACRQTPHRTGQSVSQTASLHWATSRSLHPLLGPSVLNMS